MIHHVPWRGLHKWERSLHDNYPHIRFTWMQKDGGFVTCLLLIICCVNPLLTVAHCAPYSGCVGSQENSLFVHVLKENMLFLCMEIFCIYFNTGKNGLVTFCLLWANVFEFLFIVFCCIEIQKAYGWFLFPTFLYVTLYVKHFAKERWLSVMDQCDSSLF